MRNDFLDALASLDSELLLSQSAIHLKINELNFCLIHGGQMVCIGAQCMSQLSV